MTRHSTAPTVVLIALLVLAASATPVVAAHPGSASIPEDEVVTADPGVYVWERSVFPLQVDLGSAATKVPVGDVRARVAGTEASIENQRFGVVTAGNEVRLTFDDARASNAQLGGTDVTVVAARVTGDEGPTTVAEAADLLSTENANENATFEVVAEDVALDGEGTREFTFIPDASGRYVFLATVSSGGGVDVTGGEISLSSDVTVVGVDRVLVQRAPAQVSPPTRGVVAGNDATFNVVDSPLSGTDVTHVLAVYKADTFAGSPESFSESNGATFTFVVDESDIDDEFTLADAELEHSIGNTVGVADVDDGISVNGADLNDGRVARSVGMGTVVDVVASDLEANSPATEATGDTTLYASVRGVASTSPQPRLTVETLGNWSAGTYRYVYVAMQEDDQSALTTTTGTLEVVETPRRQPGGGGGGGGGGASFFSSRPKATDAIDPTTGRASVTFLDTDAVHLRGIEVDLQDGTSGEVAVVANAAYPAGDAGPAGSVVATFEVSVPQPVADEPATMQIRIPKNRLGPAADAPSRLVVSRYHAGSWSDLDTSLVSTTGDTVTLETRTPGFSTFAVRLPGDGGTATPTGTPAGPTDTPPAATPTPTPIPPPGGSGTGTPADVGTPEGETPGGGGGVILLVAVVVLAGAGALAWQYRE
ncbi:MAG: PGF-pre-PGF domain-containing protein [Haloferacaceae archaeon]